MECRTITRPIPPHLPKPQQEALRLRPKVSSSDDIESYLHMFEQMALQEGWPEKEWARAELLC